MLNDKTGGPAFPVFVIAGSPSKDDLAKMRDALNKAPGMTVRDEFAKQVLTQISIQVSENFNDEDMARGRSEIAKHAYAMADAMLAARGQGAEQEWPKLDKPAMVGAGRFGVGVSARTVVEAAQRLHEREVTPENEAERIARVQAGIEEIRRKVAESDAVQEMEHQLAEAQRAAEFNFEQYQDASRLLAEECEKVERLRTLLRRVVTMQKATRDNAAALHAGMVDLVFDLEAALRDTTPTSLDRDGPWAEDTTYRFDKSETAAEGMEIVDSMELLQASELEVQIRRLPSGEEVVVFEDCSGDTSPPIYKWAFDLACQWVAERAAPDAQACLHGAGECVQDAGQCDGGCQANKPADPYRAMVDRFLGWKLPKDFGPDAGISFSPSKPYEEPGWWPVGTNLFTADQARAMFEYCVELPAAAKPTEAADGWIEWKGGECPVASGVTIQVRYPDGDVEIAKAGEFRWNHIGNISDIIAYRVVEGGAK